MIEANAYIGNKYAVGIFLWRRSANIPAILSAVKEYNPKALYIYIDGPRSEEEQIEINQVISICKDHLLAVPFVVTMDAAEKHLGLNRRFRTGITSLFTAESCAIVLEDDTIPSTSFFAYCSYYLQALYDDADIIAINGFFKARKEFVSAHNLNKPFTNHIFNPWGWASWSHKILPCYNPDMKTVSFINTLRVFSLWWNFDLFRLRRKLLRDIETGVLNTWDVQLQWSIFISKKKVVTPPVSLIKNVGNDSLASTFIAGKSDFEVGLNEISVDSFTKDIPHLPSYDIELCRSKSNNVFILNKLRKLKSTIISNIRLF